METITVLNTLLANAQSVYSAEELQERLQGNRPLIVKMGADPSRPDLHLGHTVVLRHLALLQRLGHQIVFIIGDFTGMIGDPSGRSKTRPALSFEQSRANGETYFRQVTRLLDPSLTRVLYNSQWLSKLSFADVLALAGKATLAQILAREDFAKRHRAAAPIGLHELLYPLMQGYDSVAITSDIEVGGTDQTFNLLMGRQLQKDWGQRPQTVLTFPLLPGLDGKEKMSKSLGNTIGITDPAPEMFEKCMKVPDALLADYFRLTSDVPRDQWEPLVQKDSVAAHRLYAHAITGRYWGEAAARDGWARYQRVAAGGVPEEMPQCVLPRQPISLIRALGRAGLVTSNSEARRLIAAGAIRVNGLRADDGDRMLEPGEPLALSRGRGRFVRLIFEGGGD